MRWPLLRRLGGLVAAALAALVVPMAAWAAAPTAAAPTAAATPPARPKICLVLSGGGARGAAHVGVIKVLEEYRVPIHCIAGTSMGSLVGGAYATGMSVADMEKLNESITIERLFKEKPPREELAMRRKLDDYRNYLGVEFGTSSGKASLGKGVITGVQLETVLRELARVPGYHRFDELPIPFRAVATDLVTGKAVVFSEGELANVMRASMSVPGAVAPAEYEGMMLVDGMLTSNLPVDAARAMGADIVIAVNVGTPLLKREELTSIVGVAGQMLSILTEQNVQASLASLRPQDILISPELGDYSTGDFDHLPQITPLGEAAARKVAEQLAALSVPAEEYAALRQRQQVAVVQDLRPVDEIRFEKLQTVTPAAAQSVMETTVGKPLEQAVIDADMRRLYGTGDFEHVNYRILEEPGRRVLAVEAIEKAWGPNYLQLGLGLASDFAGRADFNVLVSHRMTWLNSLGAELRTDAAVGSNNSLRVEFYQPLDATGRFFVAPNAKLTRELLDLYSLDDRIAIYDRRSGEAALDLGLTFKQYGELRLGLAAGRVRPRLDTGSPVFDPGSKDYDKGALRLGLILDRLDNIQFPRQGWGASADLYDSRTELGADLPYTKWTAGGALVHSFGDNTVRLGARFGGTIGSNPLPDYDQFQWGGFLRQSGYATGQLMGSKLSFGQFMYYRRIIRGGLLDGAYGGISLEVGRVSDPLIAGNPDGQLRSVALFVAADTPIGPVYLGYGRADDHTQSMYFFLGNPF